MPFRPKQSAQIDPESQRFIGWAFDRLEDPDFYQAVLAEATDRLAKCYKGSKDEVLSRLKVKMERGAREHGAPIHPPAMIRQELDNECLDLLGWLLVEKWNERER